MKAYKTITIITVIILIAIVSIASFGGIYKLKEYKVIDVVPEYLLGMEFTDSRIINLKVNTEVESTIIYDKDGNEITEQQDWVEYTEENGYTTVENKVNSDDILTKENFKKAKSILSSRLISLGADEYTIKQDENNGDIQIEMTQNKNTDKIIDSLIKKGTFELKDKDTSQVLIDASNIKETKVVYSGTETGTTVYLQIKFNKDGQAKLEEISKTYIETTIQTTNDNGETEDSTETKEVSIDLDGETYRTTYFGETITDGVLNLAIGNSSDTTELQEYATTAGEMAIVLNTGVLPITYKATNYTVTSSIMLLKNDIAVYVAITIVLLMSVYLIIKLKTKGLLVGILQIGYIALLLLVLRYTNIKITMEGIVGILISILLNYMYIYKAFKNIGVNFVKETTAKFGLKLVPIYIIAIIFTFNSMANISSLGMTLVWGIMIMYLYNLTLTQITVKTIEDK